MSLRRPARGARVSRGAHWRLQGRPVRGGPVSGGGFWLVGAGLLLVLLSSSRSHACAKAANRTSRQPVSYLARLIGANFAARLTGAGASKLTKLRQWRAQGTPLPHATPSLITVASDSISVEEKGKLSMWQISIK